jgi:hypothetical protein
LKGFVEICHCVQECRTTSENWFLKHGYVAKMEAINFPAKYHYYGRNDSGKSTVGSYKPKTASQFPMKAIACTSHVTQLRALGKSSAQRVDSGGDLWNFLSPPNASAPGGATPFVSFEDVVSGEVLKREDSAGKRSCKNARASRA